MATYVFKDTVAGIPEDNIIVLECGLLPLVHWHGRKCSQIFSYLPWDCSSGKVVTVVFYDVFLTSKSAYYII